MFWLWLLLPLSWEENQSLEKKMYTLFSSLGLSLFVK